MVISGLWVSSENSAVQTRDDSSGQRTVDLLFRWDGTSQRDRQREKGLVGKVHQVDDRRTDPKALRGGREQLMQVGISVSSEVSQGRAERERHR